MIYELSGLCKHFILVSFNCLWHFSMVAVGQCEFYEKFIFTYIEPLSVLLSPGILGAF